MTRYVGQVVNLRPIVNRPARETIADRSLTLAVLREMPVVYSGLPNENRP
jgi:hypothetical protein